MKKSKCGKETNTLIHSDIKESDSVTKRGYKKIAWEDFMLGFICCCLIVNLLLLLKHLQG